MELDSVVDFSSETIKEYENYDESIFQICSKLFHYSGQKSLNDEDLESVLFKLNSSKLLITSK